MAAQTHRIEVFYWTTPNGRKITVMLEELGVPYSITYVDLSKNEQWAPAVEAVSPHHQIPAILDPEGPGGEPISVFESGAILLYLARKFGRFYPQDDERKRVEVEKWLIWQVANFGPFLGQAHHFNFTAPEKVPYAIERYRKIAERLYAVLDRQLTGRPFVADEYSIADIAIYCWVARHERHRIDLHDYPAVERWFGRIGERPAVRRGMTIVKPSEDHPAIDPVRTGKAVGATGGNSA